MEGSAAAVVLVVDALGVAKILQEDVQAVGALAVTGTKSVKLGSGNNLSSPYAAQ